MKEEDIAEKKIMKFDSTSFDLSYLPDIQKIIWMKPEEFLSKATPFWNLSDLPKGGIFSPSEKTENLKQKMLNNKLIDPLYLYLDVDNCEIIEHDGRHRALSAKKLNIDRVPVIVYHYDKYGEESDIRDNKNCQCTVFNAKQQI